MTLVAGRTSKRIRLIHPDEQGNRRELLPRRLEDIVSHIKGKMKEGENEEDVDINIEMPPSIVKDILDNSRKRKADGSIDCRPCKVHNPAQGKCSDAAPGEDPGDVEGDRQAKLEQYCTWTLTQVRSDRVEDCLTGCESGCNRSVPRAKHYLAASKGRCRTNGKEWGETRHCNTVCEQH